MPGGRPKKGSEELKAKVLDLSRQGYVVADIRQKLIDDGDGYFGLSTLYAMTGKGAERGRDALKAAGIEAPDGAEMKDLQGPDLIALLQRTLDQLTTASTVAAASGESTELNRVSRTIAQVTALMARLLPPAPRPVEVHPDMVAEAAECRAILEAAWLRVHGGGS